MIDGDQICLDIVEIISLMLLIREEHGTSSFHQSSGILLTIDRLFGRRAKHLFCVIESPQSHKFEC